MLVKRSIAFWARSGSANVASHSSGPVRGDDDRAGAIRLQQEVVEVAAFGRAQHIDRKIIQEEQVDGDELSQLGVVAVVEACVLCNGWQPGCDNGAPDKRSSVNPRHPAKYFLSSFASLKETWPGVDWKTLADYTAGRVVLHGERDLPGSRGRHREAQRAREAQGVSRSKRR